MTTFRFLRASQWGFWWGKTPVTETLEDDELYMHHTAGSHFGFPEDAVGFFKAHNQWSINQGYSATVYDVLCHYAPKADVFTAGEFRGPYMSASQFERNEQGEGLALMGNFQEREPYPAEIEGMCRAAIWMRDMRWISSKFRIDPGLIRGHRDNPNQNTGTPCPGNKFYKHMPYIRTRILELDKGEEEDMYSVRLLLNSTDGKKYQNQLVAQWIPNVEALKAWGLDTVDVVEATLTPSGINVVRANLKMPMSLR